MTSNKNLGNAGEFYVLAQLAQRGYIAGKTDDGQTLIDVIATDEETLKTVNIQVKATGDYGKIPSWIMSKKNGLQMADDHYGFTVQRLFLHRVYRRDIPNKIFIKTTLQSPYRDIAENL